MFSGVKGKKCLPEDFLIGMGDHLIMPSYGQGMWRDKKEGGRVETSVAYNNYGAWRPNLDYQTVEFEHREMNVHQVKDQKKKAFLCRQTRRLHPTPKKRGG
jgi:hypothetical protein